jgi:hypothetical protein
MIDFFLRNGIHESQNKNILRAVNLQWQITVIGYISKQLIML